MKLPEYDTLDAMGQAELVRERHVSPAELLDAAIERIEARNPAVNAVVSKLYERAKTRVNHLPDGPLKGVPFLLKDLKLKLKGTVTTNSSLLTANQVAPHSSVLAERYEAAGLQIVGKTNTPEFGIMGITEPELRGPCRNPWNTGHTPGGSSGGSGSAVAARMVALAHAGDGGGSIRIPAACCGLFGIKPSRGRVTMAPFLGHAWGGFVQEHVLTRSVRDSALLLDLTAIPTPGDPYAAPPKAGPWIEDVSRDPGKLKIAFTPDPLFGDMRNSDCEKGVADAVTLLKELGHEVMEAKPRFDREKLVKAYFTIVAAGVAAFVEDTAAYARKKPSPKDFEPSTWMLATIGWRTSAAEMVHAEKAIHETSRIMAKFMEDHDVFVTATLGTAPAKVGELMPQPGELMQMEVLRRMPLKALLDFAVKKMGDGKLAYLPNTQLFNQSGQPAMSVPLLWNGDGLPIGTQFVGRFGDEATLFSLAGQLEKARPWADQLPPGLLALARGGQ